MPAYPQRKICFSHALCFCMFLLAYPVSVLSQTNKLPQGSPGGSISGTPGGAIGKPTILEWTPKQMVSAYADWVSKQPKLTEPASVICVFSKHYGANIADLNTNVGSVDFGIAYLHSEGNSLSGTIHLKKSDINGNFSTNNDLNLFLDGTNGRVKLGNLTSELQTKNGILLASFPFSKDITAMTLSIKSAVQLH